MAAKEFLKDWSFFRDIRRLEGRFQGAGVYDDGEVKYSVSVHINGYRELTALSKVLDVVKWVKANELKVKNFLIDEFFSKDIVTQKFEEYDYTRDEVLAEIVVGSIHVYCEDEDFVFGVDCLFNDLFVLTTASGAWIEIDSDFQFGKSDLAD